LDADQHELSRAMRAKSSPPHNPDSTKGLSRSARRPETKLQTRRFGPCSLRRHRPRRTCWTTQITHWNRCPTTFTQIDDDAREPTRKGRFLQNRPKCVIPFKIIRDARMKWMDYGLIPYPIHCFTFDPLIFVSSYRATSISGPLCSASVSTPPPSWHDSKTIHYATLALYWTHASLHPLVYPFRLPLRLPLRLRLGSAPWHNPIQSNTTQITNFVSLPPRSRKFLVSIQPFWHDSRSLVALRLCLFLFLFPSRVSYLLSLVYCTITSHLYVYTLLL
jgi:hypothetical protein